MLPITLQRFFYRNSFSSVTAFRFAKSLTFRFPHYIGA